MSAGAPYPYYRDESRQTFSRIPSHWDVARARHLVRIRTGTGDTVDAELDGPFPFYVRSDAPLLSSKWDFDTTAVLTAGDGAGVAKVFHLVAGRFMAHQRVYVLDDFRRVTPKFFYYAFSNLFHLMALDGSAKSTVDSVRRPMIADMPFAIPPLDEQRSIAGYLDRETARIDTLIEEQQRLIEMLRERRTAVIANATAQGEDVELRRVIAVLRQGWSPNCESWPADGVAEWGVLKVGCANTGRFNPAENKRLPDDETPRPELAVNQGELVMSRSNTKDLVGAAAVVDGSYPRLLLSDLTYGLSLADDADPAFVAYALGSPRMRAQIGAASKGMSQSMQKISQRDIRELRLRLPALTEQRHMVAHLDGQTAKIDALIAETGRFIDLTRERRSALITAAVTGQIDVREMA
ncbi:restriction endonuclease subunit S [Pilimelia columellifera]|uniref:Restriction endonuclease subunit S n=1 Tax=Pilimelia columellifera subsp. columellifera TaxID=706583 RepID=A0ABP6AGJ9_9ACTN